MCIYVFVSSDEESATVCFKEELHIAFLDDSFILLPLLS